MSVAGIFAQQNIGPRTYVGGHDATQASHTSPVKTDLLANRPTTCTVGEMFFATDAAAGGNIYLCTSTNTWTQLTGGSGGSGTVNAGTTGQLAYYPANGTAVSGGDVNTVVRDNPIAYTSVTTLPAASSAVVGRLYHMTAATVEGVCPPTGDSGGAASAWCLSNGLTYTSFSTFSGTAGALNLPSISDPGTPVSGDVWNNAGVLKLYDGAATRSMANIPAYTSVTYSATPTFTATSNTGSTSFLITLTGDVTSSTLAGAATGQILNFRICQDSPGAHAFAWPTNVLNAGTVDPTALACSNQVFVFDGSNAVALGAMYVTGVTGGSLVLPGSTSGESTLVAPATGGGTVTLPAGSGTLQYLPNVTNDAQTKAAVMPNTAPSAGQFPVGNAGGTAYAPVSMSGDATMASTGAMTIAANAVNSSKMAVVNTRRVCDIVIGDTSGSALTDAQLGPQKRLCFIPAAAHLVELDVAADGGTPQIIVGVNHAGSVTNITTAALATAAAGGIACANVAGSGTGIDGATTCAVALATTTAAAGDYIEAVSGTAGGTAKLMTVHVIYTID